MTTQTQALASEMKPPAKEAWDSAHITRLPMYHTRLSMRAEETASLTVEIPGDLAERLHAPKESCCFSMLRLWRPYTFACTATLEFPGMSSAALQCSPEMTHQTA
jgi:hypothetical protein